MYLLNQVNFQYVSNETNYENQLVCKYYHVINYIHGLDW
jgi:hypothetical protein